MYAIPLDQPIPVSAQLTRPEIETAVRCIQLMKENRALIEEQGIQFDGVPLLEEAFSRAYYYGGPVTVSLTRTQIGQALHWIGFAKENPFKMLMMGVDVQGLTTLEQALNAAAGVR